MKKIIALILFLAVITAGCSYDITAGNDQELQGENENWKVDYTVKFTTIYSRNDGKIYAQSMEQKRITAAYKKNLSDLSSVRHIEISYQDSFGGNGRKTEEYDTPPSEKQFRFSGGASTTTHELNSVDVPENLQRFIMIFSGPGHEMRTSATADVTIGVDGKKETVRLMPVQNPSPIPAFLEDLNKKLSKKPFLRFFSGRASDLSFKLQKYDIHVIHDKAVSGSVNMAEGGERKELVPAALFYEFVIRNEGGKPISGNMNDLQIKIVPSDALKKVSEKTVGVNLFEPDSSFGSGQSVDGNIFSIHKDSALTLSFDLCEVSPDGTMITPPEEKLEKLLEHASDASLIIIYKGEEAARIDLNPETGIKK